MESADQVDVWWIKGQTLSIPTSNLPPTLSLQAYHLYIIYIIAKLSIFIIANLLSFIIVSIMAMIRNKMGPLCTIKKEGGAPTRPFHHIYGSAAMNTAAKETLLAMSRLWFHMKH